MCGIAGMFATDPAEPLPAGSELLQKMLAMIGHRGPDSFGGYSDRHVQLGSARLSIIDHKSGHQPIHNEDNSIWIVYNGEIYNYLELRKDLVAHGHHFRTSTDTEVIVHLFEERGARCLDDLNGQFAFALWDRRKQELFLARDRLGVRPLFYTQLGSRFSFASEIKALLSDPAIDAKIDPIAIDQVFTFWAPLPAQTMFKDVHQVPPGHYLRIRYGKKALTRYWHLMFPTEDRPNCTSLDAYEEQLRELLIDATRLRLRADVPVGAYLSGGLDSSIVAAIVRNHTNNHLRTFSIAFSDDQYDETDFQQTMVAHLGTEHQRYECSSAEIARVFPEVIWHAEMPLLRTAPAPLYLLSKMVHKEGFKVVLTGEGADEFLGGYDIFKEAMIRRFWGKQPDSSLRPLLLRRMYGFVPDLQKNFQPYLEAFFRPGFLDGKDPLYSHLIRWRNTSRLKRLFSPELTEAISQYDGIDDLRGLLNKNMGNWHPLAQAQSLEITTFMSEYLLSAQGDRMAMANSVEGRFPYLDHRVVEFCNALPSNLKLRSLNEKYLLKRAFRDLIPPEITRRTKQPYRAPISNSFFSGTTPDYVEELLSPGELTATGYFSPKAVAHLVQKCKQGTPSEGDNMGLVGIISLQLLHKQFVAKSPGGLVGTKSTPDCIVNFVPSNDFSGELEESLQL